MNLERNLAKKYIFYNSRIFSQEAGVGILLLNFSLFLYAIVD